MAQTDRTTLKSYFETDDRPTQSQFESLIDSAMPDGLYTLGTAVASKTGIISFLSETDVTAYSEGSAGIGVIQASDYADIEENLTKLTTVGDILRRNSANTADERLALGSKKTVLMSKDGQVNYARVNTSAFATSVSTVGTLWIRATANWSTLEPGAEGTVLRSTGSGALPVYASASNKYISSYVACVGATTKSYSHGLSAEPDFVTLKLRCAVTAGSGGYSLGDVIDVCNGLTLRTSQPSPLEYDAKSINWYQTGSTAINVMEPSSNMYLHHASTEGTATAVTITDWEYQVRAFLL